MIIKYEFDDESYYEFEPEYKELQKALVNILMDNCKYTNGKTFSEDGAYQMAMYMVYYVDVFDELCECFEDDLYDYFYDKAKEEYIEARDQAEYDRIDEETWFSTKSDMLGF